MSLFWRRSLVITIALSLAFAGCSGDDKSPAGGGGAGAGDAASGGDGGSLGDGGGQADTAGGVDANGGADSGAPDAGSTDAGTTDTGKADSGGTDTGGTDAGSADAGSTDAGSTDAGSTDAGSTDAGNTDAGNTDAGSTDTGATDAGNTDAGNTDAGTTDAGNTDAGTTDTGSADATPECTKDADCAAKDDGDLCNGVWHCDAGSCKAKPGSAVTCDAGKDTACAKATCDPKTGACAAKPSADGTSCSDGDACTLSDTCKAGACKAGSAAVCDDGKPCTVDSCDKAKGCQAKPAADGAACGAGKQCQSGACVSDLAAGRCGVGGAVPCSTLGAGYGHVCALWAGVVRCWGANQQGQLGTGGVSVLTPKPGTAVIGAKKVAHIAVGWSSGCALATDGSVACWGGNVHGTLGNGKSAKDYPEDKAYEAKATAITGLGDVVHLAATSAGTVCALKKDGTVWCWGAGAAGALGDGKTGDGHLVSTPTKIAGLSDVRSLSAGSGHVCAVDKAGGLWCWGYNAMGQVGNGKWAVDYPNVDLAGEPKPTKVAGLSGITQAWASGRNTCARNAAGKVWCWGTNYYGQVANGKTWKDYTTTSAVTKPEATVGVAGVSSMGGHFFHRCAVVTSPKAGSVKCWGTTYHGALGNGVIDKDDPVVAPVSVALPKAATEVVGGGFSGEGIGSGGFSCARLVDDSVQCWGTNLWGQLGFGGTAPSAKPVTVKLAACKVAKDCDDANSCTTDTCAAGFCSHAVAAGSCNDGDACTLKDACDNGWCSAGTPANCDDKDPCTIDTCDPKTAQCSHTPAADGTACGAGQVCAKAKCVSALGQGQCGADGSEPCRGLGAGGIHTCRLQLAGGATAGKVQCWGAGANGQLGLSTPANTTKPGATVSGVIDAVHLALGQAHSCALRATGQVVCWGSNSQGQLGNGKGPKDYPAGKAFEPTPVATVGVSDAVHLAASRFATCAVREGGTVRCWGTEFLGQMGTKGDGEKTSATEIKGITGAVAIAAGDDHFCVRTTKGAVHCWGWAGYGQLGNGKLSTDYGKATDAYESAPVKVAGLGAVDRVWGGGSTVCAREVGGKVSCWGRNDYGQTGNGKAAPDYPKGAVTGQPNPAVIPGLTGMPDMVGATYHRCVRNSSGQMGCWGRTTQGALGVGTSGQNSYVSSPSVLNLISSVTEMTAGGFVGSTLVQAHTCAALANGQTWCWGTGAGGQLGAGDTKDAASPTQVK